MPIIGERLRVLPAYNSETGCRDVHDDVAGLECWAVENRPNGDVLVRFGDGSEDYVFCSRLRSAEVHS